MPIHVEFYAGYHGEQNLALRFGERRVAVLAVVDRWYSPSQRWFKVEAEDGDTYIVRHEEPSDQWSLPRTRPGSHTAPAYAILSLRTTGWGKFRRLLSSVNLQNPSRSDCRLGYLSGAAAPIGQCLARDTTMMASTLRHLQRTTTNNPLVGGQVWVAKRDR
jgi:hypothetical protein